MGKLVIIPLSLILLLFSLPAAAKSKVHFSISFGHPHAGVYGYHPHYRHYGYQPVYRYHHYRSHGNRHYRSYYHYPRQHHYPRYHSRSKVYWSLGFRNHAPRYGCKVYYKKRMYYGNIHNNRCYFKYHGKTKIYRNFKRYR